MTVTKREDVTWITWAEPLSRPDEVPSDSGKVSSTANSKPRGRYPVMKNLQDKVERGVGIMLLELSISSIIWSTSNYF